MVNNFHIIIPARFASTRFPGKPLAKIANKPMIQHVYERSLQAGATSVIVATDDERIADKVNSFNGEVCMTASHHQTGTDRLAEVVQKLNFQPDDIIVNVQGDEPLVCPQAIKAVANLLASTNAKMATCATAIENDEEKLNPNVVKVVFDLQQFALYFSRLPIPFVRNQAAIIYKHIGLYAYRAAFITQFVQWPQTVLEQTESLEQLRALEHGAKIAVELLAEHESIGVDTLDDLVKVNSILTS